MLVEIRACVLILVFKCIRQRNPYQQHKNGCMSHTERYRGILYKPIKTTVKRRISLTKYKEDKCKEKKE